ncbi:MAG: hypothetical protein IM658_02695 [Phenylobacterium sp.]|jgi:hypothetical protein|uniref:hypothetical protein n=1 Tax=Phenylobacterium sp. TaxID=1871053 RepID=UPI0025ECD3F5|nr:hypothetical protein [Phenylobacterium sp.]MCA3714187.1 hypothetical protein [Phenylobacterium sp.]MCA3727571.1 hypothetical protein [Phenylobacterium sp.]MCA3734864.1 hypothetical protein [Phenylobacterium sp.]MCA3737890.1 hypothetical protein [Phenylobacterium sp.]MCA3741643.1 hypothetical protein [Phenylobacterium sp.]
MTVEAGSGLDPSDFGGALLLLADIRLRANSGRRAASAARLGWVGGIGGGPERRAVTIRASKQG